MSNLQTLLGIELPIIQAPMAGAQGSALALAVSNAGGLGSLPCAMLSADAMRKELITMRSQTTRPFNVNFFCHTPSSPDAEREALWRKTLGPYYAELGVDASAAPTGPGRAPFSAEAADVLSEFKPAVVSFHFGLPSEELLARVRALRMRHYTVNAVRAATTITRTPRAFSRRCTTCALRAFVPGSSTARTQSPSRRRWSTKAKVPARSASCSAIRSLR